MVPAHLADASWLSGLFGPVRRVDREPFTTPGFSAARHERLTVHPLRGAPVRLVSKRVRLVEDWTARRTDDAVGREAVMLATPELNGRWEIFANPYRGYALANGEIGLLLDDLGPYLRPGTITAEEEAQLITALATLHARYWNGADLAHPVLARPAVRFSILGPGAAAEEMRLGPLSPLFSMVHEGWELALRNVPAEVHSLLLRNPEFLTSLAEQLPATLLHADAKIDNFAWLPDGRIAAFDWATTGAGIATLDLAYYLAVNWHRSTRTKEKVIVLYRTALQNSLGETLEEEVWAQMLTLGLVGGALMLLWSKALAVKINTPGALAEWQWWIKRLKEAADALR